MLRRLLFIHDASLLAALVAPAVANADFIHFTTPSKNIDCIADFSAPTVDCIVERASWSNAPPKPFKTFA